MGKCSKCGIEGHNRRTCQKNMERHEEVSSSNRMEHNDRVIEASVSSGAGNPDEPIENKPCYSGAGNPDEEKEKLVLNNDISGLTNINELYNNSLIKKWIKLLPTDKTILLEEYTEKDYFIKIADIVLDTDVDDKGKKKRKTLIKLDNYDDTIVTPKCEYIYLIVINRRIVKIGGTRDGIKGRFGSYLCGHQIKERGKSGDCSKTNAFIYNTFEFYLNLGCKIEMYGYKLPKTEMTIKIFGKETKIIAQTYHAYESVLINNYKKRYGNIPYLCNNCDPDYKE
jgi:hypothetical protein